MTSNFCKEVLSLTSAGFTWHDACSLFSYTGFSQQPDKKPCLSLGWCDGAVMANQGLPLLSLMLHCMTRVGMCILVLDAIATWQSMWQFSMQHLCSGITWRDFGASPGSMLSMPVTANPSWQHLSWHIKSTACHFEQACWFVLQITSVIGCCR